MLFKNSLHPWCVAVWVCNNAQCNNSEDNLFFELGVYKWKKGATSNGYDSLNICGFNLIKKGKKADHLIKLENKPRNRLL